MASSKKRVVAPNQQRNSARKPSPWRPGRQNPSSVQQLESKLEALTEENAKLKETLQMCKEDFAEVSEHLKKTIERKDDEVANLEDQLERERAETAFDSRELSKSFESKIANLEEDVMYLQADKSSLGTKLKEVSTELVDRSVLEQRLRNLEQELARKENENADALLECEREAIRQKDRQKEELTLHFNALIRQLQEEAYSQIQGEAKRIFEENKSLAARLAELEEQNMMLMEKNKSITDRLKMFRKEQFDADLITEKLKADHSGETRELRKTVASLKKEMRYTEAKQMAVIEEKEFEIRNMKMEMERLDSVVSELNSQLEEKYRKHSIAPERKMSRVDRNGTDKSYKELHLLVNEIINSEEESQESRKAVFVKLAEVLDLQ